jgi:hypothetical protein
MAALKLAELQEYTKKENQKLSSGSSFPDEGVSSIRFEQGASYMRNCSFL